MHEALRSMTVPRGAPPNTLFVPEAACPAVLQWGHASKLGCHSDEVAPYTSCGSFLVAHHDPKIQQLTSPPVLCAPVESPRTSLLRGFSIPYRFRNVPSPTSPWTS